jgi:hypothetical protein
MISSGRCGLMASPIVLSMHGCAAIRVTAGSTSCLPRIGSPLPELADHRRNVECDVSASRITSIIPLFRVRRTPKASGS